MKRHNKKLLHVVKCGLIIFKSVMTTFAYLLFPYSFLHIEEREGMGRGTQSVARMPRNIVQVRKSVKTLLECSMEKN